MDLVPYFDGVLEGYFSCQDADEKNMPPKLKELVDCLRRHEVPSDTLIQYSSSRNLWTGMKFDQSSVEYACRIGALGYLKWVFSWNEELDKQCTPFIDACRYGHLEVVKWIHSQGVKISRYDYIKAFDYSCKYNRLVVAKWLTEHSDFETYQSYVDKSGIVSSACQHGSIEMLKWLISLGFNVRVISDTPFREACANGHLEIAQFLEQKYPIDRNAQFNEAFRKACEYGHLEVAKWLASFPDNEHDALDDEAFTNACESGNLELAKWFMETYPTTIITLQIFETTCRNGQLEVAKWLVSLFDDFMQRMSFVRYVRSYGGDVGSKIANQIPC